MVCMGSQEGPSLLDFHDLFPFLLAFTNPAHLLLHLLRLQSQLRLLRPLIILQHPLNNLHYPSLTSCGLNTPAFILFAPSYTVLCTVCFCCALFTILSSIVPFVTIL